MNSLELNRILKSENKININQEFTNSDNGYFLYDNSISEISSLSECDQDKIIHINKTNIIGIELPNNNKIFFNFKEEWTLRDVNKLLI